MQASRTFTPCKQCTLQARRPARRLRSISARAQNSEPLRTRFEKSASNVKSAVAESASKLRTRVGEAARDADAQLGVSQRAKHALQDFKRLAPYWRRTIQQRASTRTGKVALWGFFIWSISSGLFWKVLDTVFHVTMFWFTVPLLLLPFLRLKRAQQGQQQKSAQRPGGQSRNNRQRQSTPQDGPVYDAEWASVDQ